MTSVLVVDVAFTGVPVADIESGSDWYERLIGRPADIVVNEIEVMWRLHDAAWLYVVEDAARAGGALVALCVADLDGAVAGLGDRGISCGPIETVGQDGRKAVVHDGDGNSVSLIEVTTRPG